MIDTESSFTDMPMAVLKRSFCFLVRGAALAAIACVLVACSSDSRGNAPFSSDSVATEPTSEYASDPSTSPTAVTDVSQSSDEQTEPTSTETQATVTTPEITTPPKSDEGIDFFPEIPEEYIKEGWIVWGEKAYYIDKDGSFLTGKQTVDGTSYTFTEYGVLEKGWILIDNVRYHFANCTLSKGTQSIDGKTRYINSDGTMIVGWYDVKDGERHYYDFETGASYRGWNEIDGKIYYFNSSGVMARNKTVDGVKIDKNGVADGWPDPSKGLSKVVEITPDMVTKSLADALDEILETYGSTPKDIYDYVNTNFSYKYVSEENPIENAQHLLDYGTGACYNYAALTYLLFQRAGYDVCYMTGVGRLGSYHCWIAAYFDGDWYYVDSLYVRSAKLTADELHDLGYEWDASLYADVIG